MLVLEFLNDFEDQAEDEGEGVVTRENPTVAWLAVTRSGGAGHCLAGNKLCYRNHDALWFLDCADHNQNRQPALR